MRLGLKMAIFATGKSQRQIASESGIPENRLSELVRGWADPRDEECSALIRVLACSADVFDRDAVVEAHGRGRLG